MCFSTCANKSSAKLKRHRKPWTIRRSFKGFQLEDYAVILFNKGEISHENQLFSQRKYVYPFYFLYLFPLKDCSDDQDLFKLYFNPCNFSIQLHTHLSSYRDSDGKHPYPYGALPHPRGDSYLVKFICQDNLAIPYQNQIPI